MEKQIIVGYEPFVSNVAVLQYTNVINDILDEKITDEQGIACILDGILNFCEFNEMLFLFKQICRGLYLKHPGLVDDYILYYRETWDKQLNFIERGRIKCIFLPCCARSG